MFEGADSSNGRWVMRGWELGDKVVVAGRRGEGAGGQGGGSWETGWETKIYGGRWEKGERWETLGLVVGDSKPPSCMNTAYLTYKAFRVL